eukprot:SAG31_NODE_1874_length_7020_cov_57.579541_5_plen_465_part_00
MARSVADSRAAPMQVVEWRGKVDRDHRRDDLLGSGSSCAGKSTAAMREVRIGRLHQRPIGGRRPAPGFQIDLSGVPQKLGGGAAGVTSSSDWLARLQQEHKARELGATASGGTSCATNNKYIAADAHVVAAAIDGRVVRQTDHHHPGDTEYAAGKGFHRPTMVRTKLFGSRGVASATMLDGICPHRAARGVLTSIPYSTAAAARPSTAGADVAARSSNRSAKDTAALLQAWTGGQLGIIDACRKGGSSGWTGKENAAGPRASRPHGVNVPSAEFLAAQITPAEHQATAAAALAAALPLGSEGRRVQPAAARVIPGSRWVVTSSTSIQPPLHSIRRARSAGAVGQRKSGRTGVYGPQRLNSAADSAKIKQKSNNLPGASTIEQAAEVELELAEVQRRLDKLEQRRRTPVGRKAVASRGITSRDSRPVTAPMVRLHSGGDRANNDTTRASRPFSAGAVAVMDSSPS